MKNNIISPITPSEINIMNINQSNIDKYIELINHDMKMYVLNNIATAWLCADIDHMIPLDMCAKIAQKYINAGWNHIYYTEYTNKELRGKHHIRFFISTTEIKTPSISSYTHVYKEIEKIKSAAIMYREKGDTEFKYVEGHSHADCINAFSCMDLYSYMRDTSVEVQGFMTTENRFVDRIEGLKIAKNANQVSEFYNKDYLISEAIDWSK